MAAAGSARLLFREPTQWSSGVSFLLDTGKGKAGRMASETVLDVLQSLSKQLTWVPTSLCVGRMCHQLVQQSLVVICTAPPCLYMQMSRKLTCLGTDD